MKKTIYTIAIVLLLAGCQLPTAAYTNRSARAPTPSRPTATHTAAISPAPPRTATITATRPPTPTPATCIVTTGMIAGTVNVRQKPSTTATLVAVANEGDALIILSTAGKWYEIITPARRTGYIHARWCQGGATQ